MSNELILPAASIKNFILQGLQAVNVPVEDAGAVADAMVYAHLRGFDTHGLPCLPGYIECLLEERINTRPQLQIEMPSAWTATIDADNGLGAVAATKGMQLALKNAETIGIGAVTIKRSNHFGAAGAFARMALQQDCIGIIFSNAAAATAPFGATEAYLGTNPMAIAVPAGKKADYLLDMATSEGSRKKVRKALAEKTSLPAGWALDQDGNPTTEPAKALEGVMLPFGGPKGSAIALLADILSGVLSGAQFGNQVLSVFSNQQRECGTGHFLLAMKISSFMPIDDFKQRMDEELEAITKLKPAKGFAAVSYPGERENRVYLERTRLGVPLTQQILVDMNKISKHLNISTLQC